MKRLPPNVAPYKRTPEFDETTLPAGLRRAHTTKAGVWGRICVLEGQLIYRINEPEPEEHLLEPGKDGVVEPKIPHEVEPVGRMRMVVEFWR